METLRQLWLQVTAIWAGMGMLRRVVVVLGVSLLVALLLGIAFFTTRTDYRVLYANLTAEDAGAVTNALQNQAIPYKLEAGGTTVMVPAEKVNQAIVQLAVEGLPAKSGKGYELFDQTTLGMTPFTQHVNYLRALQAELAKSIMQIEPVVYARVHIVRPDPSPFVREQKPTTASVVLRLKPNMNLSRSAAAGIGALVARGVEGLTPDNVTLLDANGRVLSEAIGSDAGLASAHLEYRRTLEQYLANKAEDMLSRVLGPGRAIVRVAADINFQRLKERKETYNPEGKVVLEEKIQARKSKTSGTGTRGATGAATNLPGRPGAGGAGAGGGGTNDTSDESTETKFAISKTIQEFEDKFGTIERLTIAALVDLAPAEADKEKGTTPMILSDAQDLIKQAVGFKTDRDQIKVSEVRLAGQLLPTGVDETLERMQLWKNIVDIVRNGSLALAALVALVLGWMFLSRLRPAPTSPPPETAARQQTLDRLATAARQNPELIARIVSAWMEQTAPGGPGR